MARVKDIRIHDFRHSCDSLLIDSGANITLVTKYLGHSKIDETLNTYSHMYQNRLQNIVQLIEVQNTKLLENKKEILPEPKQEIKELPKPKHKVIKLLDAEIIKIYDNNNKTKEIEFKKEKEEDLVRQWIRSFFICVYFSQYYSLHHTILHYE